jgi:hypothetical protein
MKSPSKKAKGRIKRPGVMTKLEERYSERLELLKETGEILRWDYEPAKLRLAKGTWYTPDFRVITKNNYIEYHETKGFWRSTGRVKIKVAAEVHDCYKFVAVQWKNKAWEFEYFG